MTPENSRDIERGLMMRAALMISSMEMSPLCLMFLTFFLSLGGSLRALMMRAAAEGTTEQVACLFWILSWTVTFRPFQSPVALAMSSPIFLGDKPRGPTVGGEGGGGSNLSTHGSQVDILHLIGVELGSHLVGLRVT
eukprot:TRINITY_DN148_c0_g1_i13.p2 TRINITY_DN148_c0_g1~~TRINITY_DN148_c0_g1_i13.p2  ORF type:complete len:137 (+),score=17.57 TRINITY_DN148_c0_g1_i13:142-552(+)